MPNFVWPLNTIISTSFVINIMMLQGYRLPRQNFYAYWGTPAAVLFTIRNPWRDKNFWATPLYTCRCGASLRHMTRKPGLNGLLEHEHGLPPTHKLPAESAWQGLVCGTTYRPLQ